MRMDRFTTLAQQALATASQVAMSRRNSELAPLHLLHALLEEESGTAQSILGRAGVQPQRLKQVVDAELARLPTVSGAAQPTTASALLQVLQAAEKEAK